MRSLEALPGKERKQFKLPAASENETISVLPQSHDRNNQKQNIRGHLYLFYKTQSIGAIYGLQIYLSFMYQMQKSKWISNLLKAVVVFEVVVEVVAWLR